MGHKHAELMALYAQDAMESETPWERWEYQYNDLAWDSLDDNPLWDNDVQYRRKPQTININGFEVPEPLREPLKRGDSYYTCRVPGGGDAEYTWFNDETDTKWLDLGVIHLTKEAANLHRQALLSFTDGTKGNS